MKKYIGNVIIPTLLIADKYIVMSWGVVEAKVIDYGLEFEVNGFKFQGTVRVVWTGNGDTYNVIYLKDGKVEKVDSNISNDKLVDTIDNYVEKTDNYEEDVQNWLLDEVTAQTGFNARRFKNIMLVG